MSVLMEPSDGNGFIQTTSLRERLQVLLDDKEKQLQLAGTLGQRVLAQQMELEERINQLSSATDAGHDYSHALDDDTRERLRELAEILHSWDKENSGLFAAIGVKESKGDGLGASTLEDASAEHLVTSARGETSRQGPSAVQSSRRAKNAAHRADDVEFAFEIGSGLLTEVRRLQSLLGERDKAIQDMKEEKDDLERTVTALRASLHSQEQSADKFKEENWNLEVALQELRSQNTEFQTSIQRMESDYKRLNRQLTTAREASDKYKNEAELISATLAEHKAKHETDIAQMRKTAASLQRDKSDLQLTLENVKADAEKRTRGLKGFASPVSMDRAFDPFAPVQVDEVGDGPLSQENYPGKRDNITDKASSSMEDIRDELFQDDLSGSTHPGGAGTPALLDEVEALKRNYAHAQRQIATLKNTLLKEKEMRLDQKRQLTLERGIFTHEEANESDLSDVERAGEADKKTTKAGRRGAGRTNRARPLVQRPGPPSANARHSGGDARFYVDSESDVKNSNGTNTDAFGLLSSDRSEGSPSVDMDPAFANILADQSFDPSAFAPLVSLSDPPQRPPFSTNALVSPTQNNSVEHSVMDAHSPLAEEMSFGMPIDASSSVLSLPPSAEVACQTDDPSLAISLPLTFVDSCIQTDISTSSTDSLHINPPTSITKADAASQTGLVTHDVDAYSELASDDTIDLLHPLPKSRSHGPPGDDGTETETDWQDARESITAFTPGASTSDFHSFVTSEHREDHLDSEQASLKTSRPSSVSHLQDTTRRHRELRDVASQTDLMANSVVSILPTDQDGRINKSFPFQFVPALQEKDPSFPDWVSTGMEHSISDARVHDIPVFSLDKGHPSRHNAHGKSTDPSSVDSISGDTALVVPGSPPPVNKTLPPSMILPPPPKIPPPPQKVDKKASSSYSSGTMPPPAEVPERKATFPSRPTSPPPRDLIQRATTPTSVRAAVPFVSRHRTSIEGEIPHSHTRVLKATNKAASNILTPLSSQPEIDRRQLSAVSLLSDALSSIQSRRSSLSSEQHNLNINPPTRYLEAAQAANHSSVAAIGTATDPNVIHAITQTMIGEFLYKYTRRTIGKGHGEKRHRRYFWVHPYTKTLYWSSSDPSSSDVSESNAKSAFIQSVRSILDPNPMPPGLHQYSVVVSTPQREMKITAPTKERHDIWLNALQFLLSRPTQGSVISPAQNRRHTPGVTDLFASPKSARTSASGFSGDTWNVTPRAHYPTAQLSPAGSMRKRPDTPAAEYLRWGPDGPTSPTRSLVGQGFEHISFQEPGEDNLDFEIHDEIGASDGFEGLENVRTCCNGAHIIGQHHHKDHLHHVPDEPQHRHRSSHARDTLRSGHRPVSPSGWSFRSRTGSSHSHETGSILSWGRSQEGKRRDT